MKLDHDWKRTLRHAWSVRWIALAAVLTGIEVILPLFSDASSPQACIDAWG